MSVILRGGYDAIRKSIVNTTLLNTTNWNIGKIYVNTYVHVCNIKSTRENIIEMVRCDDKHTLMLNNMIVYSHPNLYTYDIILRLDNDLDHYGQKNIHSFVKYNYINYSNLRDIHSVRCLN